MSASQIYGHFLWIRQSSAWKSTASGGNGNAQLTGAVTKIFRRYLERKIEADTLEEEARTKNVSLNEIEEERNKGGARRRLRRRRRSNTAIAAASEAATAQWDIFTYFSFLLEFANLFFKSQKSTFI